MGDGKITVVMEISDMTEMNGVRLFKNVHSKKTRTLSTFISMMRMTKIIMQMIPLAR